MYIVMLDRSGFSVIEIFRHWKSLETLVSYSGPKRFVAEWCSILVSMKNVIDALANVTYVL
jgi:hypothetical protein